MRILVTLCSVFLIALAQASGPGLHWGNDWAIQVYKQTCSLKRTYQIFVPSEPNRRGFLSDTAYNGASIMFFGYGQASDNPLDNLRFSLHMTAEKWPLETGQQIVAVEVDEFHVVPLVSRFTGEHSFMLSTEQSARIFELLVEKESINFKLHFADGETRQFEAPDHRIGNFKIWGAMFETCIRENRD